MFTDKISSMIERCARVGVAVRLLVHMETVESLLQEWTEIAKQFIVEKDRAEFADLLELRAAEFIKEYSEQNFKVPGAQPGYMKQVKSGLNVGPGNAKKRYAAKKQKTYQGRKAIYRRSKK